MPRNNIAVYGIYLDEVAAGEAVDELKRIGFRAADISVLLSDNIGSKDFGHEKHTKSPEGASAGAILGTLTGGVLGWLAGIGAFGALPGPGPFAGVEPIVLSLSAAGAVGFIGWILGALIGTNIPEYEAKRYEGRTRNAGILLSVHCDNIDWTKRAKSILRHTGAGGIASRAEAGADFGASEKPSPRTRISGVLERADPITHTSTCPPPDDIVAINKILSRDILPPRI